MIVLDCSAAVSIVRKTAEGRAFNHFILNDDKVIAPELYLVELASALSKYHRAGLVEKEALLNQVREAADLVDELVSIKENYIEAFSESLRLGHSAYDMLYFTLARRNGATLMTLDLKLIQLCEQEGVDCIHIVDF